jgi:hypothetical protein
MLFHKPPYVSHLPARPNDYAAANVLTQYVWAETPCRMPDIHTGVNRSIPSKASSADSG